MMPELRLALIALGVVLVLAVYLYTRWQSTDRSSDDSRSERPSRKVPEGELPSIKVNPRAGNARASDDKAAELPRMKAERTVAQRFTSSASSPMPGDGESSDTKEKPEEGHDRFAESPRHKASRDEADTKAVDSIDSELTAPHSTANDTAASKQTPSADDAELDYDPDSQKIVALHVKSMTDRGMDGAGLRSLLESAGVHHGQYDIFHRSERGQDGRAALMFSVANMVEPGYFDLDTMDQSQYRGVSLFAVLPGPLPGVQTFHEMLALAHRIAEQLAGDVRDEARNPLNRQRATHIEEEIIEFERLRRQRAADKRRP